MGQFDESAFTEHPTPSLTDGLTHAARTVPGLSPEHAMIAARSDNPNVTAQSLAGLNLLSGAYASHVANTALNKQLLTGQYSPGAQGPLRANQTEMAPSYRPAPYVAPGPVGAQGTTHPQSAINTIVPTQGRGAQGQFGIDTGGYNGPLMNQQQINNSLYQMNKTDWDRRWDNTHKKLNQWSDNIGEAFGQIFGVVGGSLDVAGSALIGFSNQTPGAAWTQGYDQLHNFGASGASYIAKDLFGIGEYALKLPGRINQLGSDFAEAPGGTLARMRHDVAADAHSVLYAPDHFYRYMVQTVHDKGWSYALGEMAAMIAMAFGTGGEGTVNAVRQLGTAGKSFAEMTTPLALRGTKLPLRDGAVIGDESASPLAKFSGLNDTTRGAYERYRSIVESKAVAGTRFAFKPITEPLRRLAVMSADPGVALGEAMAMNHPLGIDAERWKQTENQDTWINPYTGVAASLGQQTMLMMGIDPKSWEGSILSGGLDFYSKFIMPDPLGAGLQVFTTARSLEGCKGLLGQLWGGTGIRSASDYDRIYKQYGAFRRTVQLIARSSSADLIRLYKGKLSPEMLTRFGNAKTVEEVLDVFKSEAAAVEFQTTNMATLGGYARTKYAMKDYLLRDPTLTAEGAVRKGILQERLFASTPYIAMRNVGASIAKTMTQRGFYLSDTAGGTTEILVDKIVDGSIQSAHVLADRLTRMGVSQDVVKVTLEHLLEASRLGETQRYMQLAVNAQIKAGPRFVQALLRDPAMGPESIVVQHIAEESMKGRLHVDAVGTKGKYVHDDRDSELVNFSGETVATAGEGTPHLQSVPLLDPVQIRRAMRVLVRLSKDPVLMDLGVAMMMANKADGYTLDLIKTFIRDYKISGKKVEDAITKIFENKVANKTSKGVWAGQRIGQNVTLFSGDARDVFLQMFRDHAVDALGNKVPLAEQINNFRGELQNLANNGLHPISRGEAAVLSTWLDGHLTTGYKPDLSDIYLGSAERTPLTPAERETIESEKYGERKLELIGDRKFLKWSDARNLRINANLTMDAMNHVVNDMFFKPATLSSPSWAWHVGISEGILNAFRYGPINMFEAHFAAQFAQKAKKYSLADGVDHNHVRNAVSSLLQDIDKKELEAMFDSDVLQIARKEALAGGYVQGNQYGRQELENLHNEIMGSVKEHGGVSINLHGKSYPSAGYGVATGSKNNVVINARDMFEDEEKAKKILFNYVKQVSENMSNKDKDLVLGIWHDTNDLTDPVLMNEFEKKHFLETTSSTTLKIDDKKTFAEITGGGVDRKGLDKLKQDGKITKEEYEEILSKAGLGKIHLDVTERIGNLTDAMKLGAERDQISIFDFENFAEYATGGSGVGGFNAFGKRQSLRKKIPIHFDDKELLKDYAERTQRLDREGFKQKVAIAYMRAQRAKAGVMLGVRESIVHGMAGEAKARRLIDDATDLVLLHPGGIHPALSAAHTRYLGEISGHVDDMELSPKNSKTKVVDPANPLAKEKTRRWKTGTFETYKRGNRGHLNAMQHYIGTALNTEQHKFIANAFQEAINKIGVKEFQRQITAAKNAAGGDIRNAAIVRDIEAQFEAHLRAQPEEWRNRFLRSKFVSRNGLEKYDIRDPLKDWARVSVSTNMNTWMSGERDITHLPILKQISEGNVKDLQWFKDYASRKGMTTMPDNIIGPRIMDGGSGRFWAQNLADKSHEKMLGPMVDYLSRRPAYLLTYHNEMENIRKTNGVYKTTIGEHKQGLIERVKFLETEIRKFDPSGTFDASLKKLHAAQAEFDRLEIEGRSIAASAVPSAVRHAFYEEHIAELNTHIASLDKEIEMLTKTLGKEARKVMAGYKAAMVAHGAQMNAYIGAMKEYNYALAQHERHRAIMMANEGLSFPTSQQHIENWQFHAPMQDMYGVDYDYIDPYWHSLAESKDAARLEALTEGGLFLPNPITYRSIEKGLIRDELFRAGIEITEFEFKCLQAYVAYDYKPINEYLRLDQASRRAMANTKIESRIGKKLDMSYKDIVKALDSVVSKVELQKPLTVFRGVDHRKYAVGELTPEPGFMSASVDFDAAHSFAVKTGRSAELVGGTGATILEIQLSPGQKLWPRNSEGELTLPRGTHLYVHEVTTATPSELYPDDFHVGLTAYLDTPIQHVIATVVDARTARALNGRYASPEVKAKYKEAATKLESARASLIAEQRKTFGYAGTNINPTVSVTPEWAQTELTRLIETHKKDIAKLETIEEKLWNPKPFIENGFTVPAEPIKPILVEDEFTKNIWRKTGLRIGQPGNYAGKAIKKAEWLSIEELLKHGDPGPYLFGAGFEEKLQEITKKIIEDGFSMPFELFIDEATGKAAFSAAETAVIRELNDLGITAMPVKIGKRTGSITDEKVNTWAKLSNPFPMDMPFDMYKYATDRYRFKDFGLTPVGETPDLNGGTLGSYWSTKNKIEKTRKFLTGGKTYYQRNTLAKLQAHVENVGKLKSTHEYTQTLINENRAARMDALERMRDAAAGVHHIHVTPEMIDEYAAKYPSVKKHVDAYKANRRAVYGDDWMPSSTGSWSGLQSTINWNKNLIASQGAWHKLELTKLQHVYDNLQLSADGKRINQYIQEHMELQGDPSLIGGVQSKHYYDSDGNLQQAKIPFHPVQGGMMHEAQAQVLAETRAARKMLGEVHNPSDKTNFEYAMRYFAPFYFAQNQAWRRAARLMAENPAAFEKYLKLTLGMTNYAQTAAAENGSPMVTIPGSQLLGRSLFGLDMGLGLNIGSMNTTTLFGMSGKDEGAAGMMQHILKPEMGPLLTIPAKLLTGSIDYAAGMVGGQDAEMKVNAFSDWLQGDIASRQPLMAQLVPNTLIRHLYQLAVDGHIGLGDSPDSAGDSVGNGYISTRLQVWKNITEETLKQLGEEMEQNGFHGYTAKEIRKFKRESPGLYTVLEQMKWAMKSHSDPRFLQDIANKANRDTAVLWSLTTAASFFGPTTVTSTSGLQQLGIQLNQELQADIAKLGTTEGYIKFAKDHPTDSMSQIFQTTSPYNVTYPSTAPTLEFIQNHGEFVLQHPTIAAFFVPRPNDAPYDEAAHAVEMDLQLRGRSNMAQMSKSALIAWGNNWYYNYIIPFADQTFGKDYTQDKATYLSGSKKMYSQYNPMWANYHDTDRLSHADDAYREFSNFMSKGYKYSYKPAEADNSFKPIELPVAVRDMDRPTQDLFYYAAQMAIVYKSYVEAYGNSSDRSGMKQQWYDYCEAMVKINPGLRSIANSMFIHLPGEGVNNG